MAQEKIYKLFFTLVKDGNVLGESGFCKDFESLEDAKITGYGNIIFPGCYFIVKEYTFVKSTVIGGKEDDGKVVFDSRLTTTSEKTPSELWTELTDFQKESIFQMALEDKVFQLAKQIYGETEYVDALTEDHVDAICNEVANAVVYDNVIDITKSYYEQVKVILLTLITEEANVEIPHEVEFRVDSDLSRFTDSMLFNSHEDEIAYAKWKMGEKEIEIRLEISGEVSVTYKGDVYHTPSEFPEELKQLIRNNPNDWDCNDDVYVSLNNWFEYLAKSNSIVFESDVSKMTPEEIKADMEEIAKQYFALYPPKEV